MQNILEEISFFSQIRVEKLQKFGNEVACNELLECPDITSLIDDKLQEDVVYSSNVHPAMVGLLLLLLDTSFRDSEGDVISVGVGERTENIFFNHVHNIFYIRNEKLGYKTLVAEHLQ